MKQTHLPVKGSLELMYALALLTAALMAAASICQAGRLRADVVRGAIGAYRLEAHQPAGVRFGGGGNAL